MEFHIKMSQFSVKSQFKESTCADWGGYSLNQDFTRLYIGVRFKRNRGIE